MEQKVKRPYHSEVRSHQRQETRERILANARLLFLEHGFAGTSVASIAKAAGVSEPLVFAQFGSKVQLLGNVIATAVAGDAEEVQLLDRPVLRAAMAAGHPRAVLHEFSLFAARAQARSWRLFNVAHEAAASEPAMREGMERAARSRYQDARRVIQSLGRLRSGLDERTATDILWSFLDTRLYEQLAVQRAWGEERFANWMGETLVALLLD